MASYRKICWTEADVKCPFYIKDNRSARSISCEGFGENNEAVTRFKTLADRDRHMGICCAARFTQCPMYKMVYETKYAGDEGRKS